MIKSAKKSNMAILLKNPNDENKISNPNSPIENEKLMNELENVKNKDRIDLDILSPDDKKQQEKP